MIVKKFYFILVGCCMLDYFFVNGIFVLGNLLNLFVWCYFLEIEEGFILVDIGMLESVVNNEGFFNGIFVEG